MNSDFINEEPNDIKGIIQLYKNIGKYFGSKENDFEYSVPTSVVLVPIRQVKIYFENKMKFFKL